uniref:Uncharacterized protein n=1 Tax=Glossina pallidipes TaxID=7398 RepID=A0A1B0AD38_GLOPL
MPNSSFPLAMEIICHNPAAIASNEAGTAAVKSNRGRPDDFASPSKAMRSSHQHMLIIQTSSKSSNVAATSSQLTSLASLPLDIPSNSSRMAPIKGYLTWPPHTSPLKSSISMVHTIAPPNPFALIQFIFERMERSSSKPTH